MWKLPAIALILAFSAACSDTCGNTLVQSHAAPSGGLTAVVFERNCGATTDFTTQVSLLAARDAPNGKGNVFIADGGSKPAPWGGPWVEATWLSAGHLLIKHDASAHVFLQNSTMSGVRVTFEKIER